MSPWGPPVLGGGGGGDVTSLLDPQGAISQGDPVPNADPRARDPRARQSDPRATELTRIIFPEGSCGIGCEVPREREAWLKRCNSLGIRYNPDLPRQEGREGESDAKYRANVKPG